MLTKNQVKKSLESLPESFSIDQLIDKILFTEKINQALIESEKGKVISNEEVSNIIAKWSK